MSKQDTYYRMALVEQRDRINGIRGARNMLELSGDELVPSQTRVPPMTEDEFVARYCGRRIYDLCTAVSTALDKAVPNGAVNHKRGALKMGAIWNRVGYESPETRNITLSDLKSLNKKAYAAILEMGLDSLNFFDITI